MLKPLKRLIGSVLFFIPNPLFESLAFESIAYFSRLFSKPLDLKAGKNYVNLGSGPNVIKGWINIDFFTTPGINYGADLRYPLKIADNSIDGIFCEHTLEHLTYDRADALLGECHRILKPGGRLRIGLPDLSIFIRNYYENNGEWFKQWEYLMFQSSTLEERKTRKLNTKLEALSFVTQEYGHVSCWDIETISHYLAKNKFGEIIRGAFMQGRDQNLLIDQNSEARKFVSLYIEAAKPEGGAR